MIHENYRTPLNGNGRSPNQPRAVVHPRTSTDEQHETGYGMEDQERKALEFCEREGLHVLSVIEDDFTGQTLDRPGLNKISGMARAKEFDVLVVVRTDRLARVAHLQRLYEDWLQKRGIEVRYVEQRFDNTPSGRPQRGIQGQFDEHDLEKIRANTMGGRALKASGDPKKGLPPAIPSGTAKYGYHQVTIHEAITSEDPDYKGRSGQLLVIEEEAAVIRTMYQLYAGGRSVWGVTNWLRENGKRARSGRHFTATTVRRILRDEIYCGRFYFGRTTVRKNNTRERDPITGKMEPKRFIVPNPREDWNEISVPIIIRRELWEAVQQRLDTNRENGRGRPSEGWLLTGILFCADCRGEKGKPIRWTGGHTYHKRPDDRRYSCGTRSRPNIDGCGGSISAKKLEEAAMVALRRIADTDWLETHARAEAERRRLQADVPAKDAARLQAELAQLDAKEERFADLILAGTSAKTVEKKIAEINDERARLVSELEAAGRQIAWPDPDAAGLVAREAAVLLRTELDAAGTDRQRLKELLRLYLEVHLGKGREPEFCPIVPRLLENGADFVKAYMHNGYLKSLKEVVHFYNTRDNLPRCRPGATGEKVTCWPAPEVPANENKVIGNLGLTDKEEDQVVAFMKTLTDGYFKYKATDR
jgi:DNA invertase Pin-like site-specific DNA recombinase